MRTYRTVCKRANEYSKFTPDILSICSNNVKNDKMIKLSTNDDKVKIEQKDEYVGGPMPADVKEKFEQMKRGIRNE